MAGIVEDQPSPIHTKEFQTLSDSANLDLIEAETEAEYVDVPTDVHPIADEVSCGTS